MRQWLIDFGQLAVKPNDLLSGEPGVSGLPKINPRRLIETTRVPSSAAVLAYVGNASAR